MPELAYRLATEETTEMQKVRDQVITLLMPVMDPDGLEVMVAWYKANRGTPYETTLPPWLHHPYAGHDNNRDGFMNVLPETQAVSKVLYTQWYPQIVYNHHQAPPAWARILSSLFRSSQSEYSSGRYHGRKPDRYGYGSPFRHAKNAWCGISTYL